VNQEQEISKIKSTITHSKTNIEVSAPKIEQPIPKLYLPEIGC
jgi:hypothetical protein